MPNPEYNHQHIKTVIHASSLFLSLSHTPKHNPYLSLSRYLSLCHTHTHTHTQTHTHTHTQTHTHTHTHARTHTYTHVKDHNTSMEIDIHLTNSSEFKEAELTTKTRNMRGVVSLLPLMAASGT